ncbi:TPA: hypothetical protein N0F65_009968 [Lagenidium giganteum]|uniref:TRP C-terminal domain-containing protein n=1 Tax=Lagenidium giganteum TaxID=4803 RepID=A0AAV2YTS0_9STRA|nr:TPA: hypothetical protein N0F65_009968 [Lagenidium giganteum]
MGCCSCCAKCCLCSVCVPVLAAAVLLATVPAFYLSYDNYWKPWGEEQLKHAPPLPDVSKLSCGDCAGINLEYPISGISSNYSQFQVYLMNEGGRLASAFTATGVSLGGASVILTSLSAMLSASAMSMASYGGGFEMFLMINQGQFITQLGSLNLGGMPQFFLEFCKRFAWTNLMVFPPEKLHTRSNTTMRMLLDTSPDATVKGVDRYAQALGVNADHLFYYTIAALWVVVALVFVIYLIGKLVITKLLQPEDDEVTQELQQRVVWATIQLLLVMQFAIAMTSWFQINYSIQTHSARFGLALAVIVFAVSCVGVVAFGVVKIAQNKQELYDLGSAEHEQKPFHRTYGAYYADFTRENRYFFVAKIGLDIASGAVVGAVKDVRYQIAALVALNAIYVLLLVIRKPYLVPFFLQMSVITGYLKVVMLLLALVQARPDVFPQRVRDLVAVVIIGVNGLMFVCLLLRQLYVVVGVVYKWCTNKKGEEDDGIPLQERPQRPQPQLDEFNELESDLGPETPPFDGTPPSTAAYHNDHGTFNGVGGSASKDRNSGTMWARV